MVGCLTLESTGRADGTSRVRDETQRILQTGPPSPCGVAADDSSSGQAETETIKEMADFGIVEHAEMLVWLEPRSAFWASNEQTSFSVGDREDHRGSCDARELFQRMFVGKKWQVLNHF